MQKCFLFVCLFFLITFKIANAKDNVLKLTLKRSPFHMTADRVKYHSEQEIIEAFGNVYLSSEDYKIRADYGKYDKKNRIIYLKKNVSANWNGNIISGDEIEVYVTNSTGWIRGGEIFYSVPHLYFRGKLMEKTGNKTFVFKDTEITGCDSRVPDWSLWIKKGRIDEDGEARLRHVFFEIKKHKVFYFPYLQLPVLVKRKSGFLIPEFVSSSRDGRGGILPYYHVLSEEQDVTFYPGYLTKRGKLLGVEYRFAPNLKTKGLVMVSYLHDKVDYNTETDAPYSYEEGLIRPNKNRYWIRGKINSYFLNPDIDLKMDIDYVSDQDYLREFDSGYLGYESSRASFKDAFGRDILNKDSLIRENFLTLTKNINLGSLYFKTIYREDVRYKNHNLDPTKDTTVQTLPEIGFNLYKTPILDDKFDLEAHSAATYFYRRYSTKGTRVDLYPKVSKTLSFIYGTIIPSIALRNTSYFLDDTVGNDMQNFENRFLLETNIDYSTQLYRVFRFGKNGIDQIAVRHMVNPELGYFHRFLRTRDDLPRFDSVDSYTREEYISYSLDNIFTLKTTNENGAKKYRDIAKLKISQKYDLKEAGREKDLHTYPKRPFSDVRLEYRLIPVENLSLTGNLWFSPYIKGITELENRFEIRPTTNLNLHTSYNYQRKLTDDIHRLNQEKLSTISFGGTFNLNNKWEFSFENEKDLYRDEVVKTWAIVRYRHQCWSISTEFDHTQDEDRVVIYISLGSLGEINQGFRLQ